MVESLGIILKPASEESISVDDSAGISVTCQMDENALETHCVLMTLGLYLCFASTFGRFFCGKLGSILLEEPDTAFSIVDGVFSGLIVEEGGSAPAIELPAVVFAEICVDTCIRLDRLSDALMVTR